MKYIGMLLAMLLLNDVSAQDVTSEDLYGSWVRVGDGCRDLSEEELLSLSENGGGNTSRRRMVLSFDKGTFHALFFPSLRCEANFAKKEKVNFQSDEIVPMCQSTIRTGSLSNLGGNIIQLMADRCSDDYQNGWGCWSQTWNVKRVGNTLRMNAIGDNDNCKATPFYIYFIPIPLS